MKEVFLGGTCNESTWRDDLIKMLKCLFFNPVVDDWTEEAQQIELYKRETCDIVLYVITPKMTGVYSIAEVVDDSNKRPEKTIFTVLDYDYDQDEDKEYTFDEFQLKSLHSVMKLVENNGVKVFDNLLETANYINSL